MTNDLYRQDVLDLLETARFGKAYLVVGFFTTSGTVWKQEQSSRRAELTSLILPVAEAAGAVGPPGLVDPQIGVGLAGHHRHGRSMQVADEEIFAIAYCELKLKHPFDKSSPWFVKKTPVVGQPQRAKAHHSAFGDSDDEVSGSEEEDVKPLDVALVEHDPLTMVDMYEDGEFDLD